MSKKEEFKSFVRDNPKLINYVKQNKMTWQKFYEIYDIYGENNEIWNEYLNEEKTEEKNNKKTSFASFNDVVNLIKNMNVDKVQEGITSLQKAVALVSDLFVKSDNNTKSSYTPRPIYRSFED